MEVVAACVGHRLRPEVWGDVAEVFSKKDPPRA